MNDEYSFSKKDTSVIKGIAIILLLLHHMFSADLLATHLLSWYPFHEAFGEMWLRFCAMGKICVSLFAFLSGYGIYISYTHSIIKKNRDVRQWYIERFFALFNRYWLIYFFVFISGCILNKFLSLNNPVVTSWFFMNGYTASIIYVLLDMFGMSVFFGTPCLIGPSWYMGAAAFFVLFLPVLLFIANKFGDITTLVLIIILPRVLGISFTGTNTALPFLFIFFLGVLCAKYNWLRKNLFSINRVIYFVISCILFCAFTYLYNVLDYKILSFFHWGIYPFYCILWINEFFIDIPPVRFVFAFLGKHSRNIFLVHIILLLNYETYMIYCFQNFFLCMGVFLISSIVFSVLIDKIANLLHWDEVILMIKNDLLKRCDLL